MTDGVMDVISDEPGPDEVEICREQVILLDREMLLTIDPHLAVVRVFGSDKKGNAVRVGMTPEASMRIGAAFIRAGLRLNPSLRAQVLDDTIGNAIAAPPVVRGGE